jgi:hypothetical protein
MRRHPHGAMERNRRGVAWSGYCLDPLASALTRKAPKTFVQRASESLPSLIVANRHKMNIGEPALWKKESEQVCNDRTLLVPDQEGTVTELVNEHGVMQLDWIAITPESGQVVDDHVEICLPKVLRLMSHLYEREGAVTNFEGHP